MSAPTPSGTKSGNQSGSQPGTVATTKASDETKDRLSTSEGTITVADTVVQKVAGMAAREINGVHAMGGSAGRAFGAIRERIPGSSGPNVSQGVGVEVGETEAAVDLDIVVEYGASVAEVARSIQRNVKNSVERMTGLKVVEVNVSVNDIHLPSDDDSDNDDSPSRVS